MSVLGDRVAAKLTGSPPHIIGIGGPVAVGKSTIAAAIGAELSERGRRVVIVATDCFLLPNAVLAERDLLYKKGFPESFDTDAIGAFVEAVRGEEPKITTPAYSHESYDIVAGAEVSLPRLDVLILEGVAALQPPALEALDVAIYVHADERDVRSWFVERFLELTARAADDASSFYRRFAEMSDDQVRALAEGTWDAINGVNLHEHIAPTRKDATIVVEKAADHSMRVVEA